MNITWLAKRYYTNKDALHERFGRVYQLPYYWAQSGETARLELLDYRGIRAQSLADGALDVVSTPVRSPCGMRDMVRRIAAHQSDVIVASGDCFVGLIALSLARKTRARFVFDVYDDYRSFAGHRLFVGWDAYGYLLHHADLVFYASRAMAQEDVSSPSWHLAPNGVDPYLFRPIDMMQSRAKCRLAESARWIGYFGELNPERGTEDLIAAVGMLNARDPTVRLLLCGQKCKGLSLNAPWVEYRGSVLHADIPSYINACNMVALPYRRGRLIDMASSCKIAEYLLCRRPLAATNTPNFSTNFPKQKKELGAALCRSSDPKDLARAIDYQFSHGHVVSPPNQHTWSAIAHDALAAIQGPEPTSRAQSASHSS